MSSDVYLWLQCLILENSILPKSCFFILTLAYLIICWGMGISRSVVTFLNFHQIVECSILIGEGFILLTKVYRFMGMYHPPFDTLKNLCFYLQYEVSTLQEVRLAFLTQHQITFETIAFIVRRSKEVARGETSMTS